jgi:hypothetical protein
VAFPQPDPPAQRKVVCVGSGQTQSLTAARGSFASRKEEIERHGHGGQWLQQAAPRREGQVHRDAVHQLRRRQLQGRRAAAHRQVVVPRAAAAATAAEGAPAPRKWRQGRRVAAAARVVVARATGSWQRPLPRCAGAEAGPPAPGGAVRLRRPALRQLRRAARRRLPLLMHGRLECAFVLFSAGASRVHAHVRPDI